MKQLIVIFIFFLPLYSLSFSQKDEKNARVTFEKILEFNLVNPKAQKKIKRLLKKDHLTLEESINAFYEILLNLKGFRHLTLGNTSEENLKKMLKELLGKKVPPAFLNSLVAELKKNTHSLNPEPQTEEP